MVATRRRKAVYEYPIRGTGDPTVDTPRVQAIATAINARQGSGKMIVSGTLALNDGISLPYGGRLKCVNDGLFDFHGTDGYVNFGLSGDYFSTATAINAVPLGQPYFELTSPGSLSIDVGDYVVLMADNEIAGGEYTRHTTSTETRPMMIHRIVSIIGNSYEVDGWIDDALTTNPRVAVISAVHNVSLENVRYRQGGIDASYLRDKTYLAAVTSTSVTAYSSGTTYSKYAFVTDGGTGYMSLFSGNIGNSPASNPAWWQPLSVGDVAYRTTSAAPNGMYAWNGSAFTLVPNTSISLYSFLFNGCIHPRVICPTELSPGPGRWQWSYSYGGYVEQHNAEDKAFPIATSQDLTGYTHVMTGAVRKWRCNGGTIGAGRHFLTSGAKTNAAHRYGHVEATMENMVLDLRGEGSSTRILDTHAEGTDIVFRHNKCYISSDASNAAIQTRSRRTKIVRNHFIGDGGLSSRGVEVFGPDCEVAHNTFENLGFGLSIKHLYPSTPSANAIDRCNVHDNVFKQLKGPAIVSHVGDDHVFDNNDVIDCGSTEMTFDGLAFGKSLIVIDDGARISIRGNNLPKYDNTWAIDMGNATPFSRRDISGNTLTGYGNAGEPVFRDDRTTGPAFESQFRGLNWVDDIGIGATPANTLQAVTDVGNETDNDLVVTDSTKGLVLSDGTNSWRITITQAGDLIATQI